MANNIYFYSTRDSYGFLSNFFPAPFDAPFTEGEVSKRWKTSEHYFQGMKTDDEERREAIRNAPSARIAAQMGRDRVLTPIRQDWEETLSDPESMRIARLIGVAALTTKDMVMLDALIFKFDQNTRLAIDLKSTFPRPLIENAPNDSYWGIGSGNGRNMLGRLLVYIRDNVIAMAPDTASEQNNRMFDNIITMLQNQDYTTIASIGGNATQIPIRDMPRGDARGMRIQKENGETLILDIYLSERYPEARLKEVIEQHKRLQVKPSYYIIGYVARGGIQRIIAKLASYNNIRFFSPAELFALPSRLLLQPRVEKILPTDERYVVAIKSRLGELSVEDLLSKELGFQRGDIIAVYDFSPHYRIIV